MLAGRLTTAVGFDASAVFLLPMSSRFEIPTGLVIAIV